MERKKELYEPVLNFRKNKPQLQTEAIEHHELYEKAFFSKEEMPSGDYSQNTTTWD